MSMMIATFDVDVDVDVVVVVVLHGVEKESRSDGGSCRKHGVWHVHAAANASSRGVAHRPTSSSHRDSISHDIQHCRPRISLQRS